MTTDDTDADDGETILTRREMMGVTGALGAVGVGIASIQPATAQTGTEPRIQLGDDWEIDDESDGSGNIDLRLHHQPSGAELKYDVSAGEWTLSSLNANSIDTGKVTIEEGGVSESALIAVAATGQTTLSSGTAVVDTGLSATDATFYLALGVDDPNADAKISGRLFWDDSAGTYKIELVESETSVGNPTVNYDILRVR